MTSKRKKNSVRRGVKKYYRWARLAVYKSYVKRIKNVEDELGEELNPC